MDIAKILYIDSGEDFFYPRKKWDIGSNRDSEKLPNIGMNFIYT